MCTETVGKAHGRIETRTLQATSSLAAYLSPAWPGLAQICRITRRRVVRGQESVEMVYAITSLTAEQADARARSGGQGVRSGEGSGRREYSRWRQGLDHCPQGDSVLRIASWKRACSGHGRGIQLEPWTGWVIG